MVHGRGLGTRLLRSEPVRHRTARRARAGVLDHGRIACLLRRTGLRQRQVADPLGHRHQTRPRATCTSQTSGSDRIQEFSSSGSFIAAFGSEGSGAGQFSTPRALAVGSSGTVFIADTANNRIEEWTAAKVSGEAPTYAASFTHSEISESPFGEPSAVAVDPSGNVWVAGGHDQVLEFNSKREYVRQFGKEGSGEGQFKGIGGIASDSSGDI